MAHTHGPVGPWCGRHASDTVAVWRLRTAARRRGARRGVGPCGEVGGRTGTGPARRRARPGRQAGRARRPTSRSSLTGGGPGAGVRAVARRRPRSTAGGGRARHGGRLGRGGRTTVRRDAGPRRRRADVGRPPDARAGRMGDGRGPPPCTGVPRRAAGRTGVLSDLVLALFAPRRIRALADEGVELMGWPAAGGRSSPTVAGRRRRSRARRCSTTSRRSRGRCSRAGHDDPRRPRHGEHGLRGRRPRPDRLGDADGGAGRARRRPLPRRVRIGRGRRVARSCSRRTGRRGPACDERSMRLALLAGLVWLGWNKALDAAEHPDPAIRARETADLDWWVRAARTTLESRSPVMDLNTLYHRTVEAWADRVNAVGRRPVGRAHALPRVDGARPGQPRRAARTSGPRRWWTAAPSPRWATASTATCSATTRSARARRRARGDHGGRRRLPRGRHRPPVVRRGAARASTSTSWPPTT